MRPSRSSSDSCSRLAYRVKILNSLVIGIFFLDLYRVVFGGSVTQYGLTIGLFFSSLGLGSFLSGRLETDPESNFFRVETYLAVVAPLGFLLVILSESPF